MTEQKPKTPQIHSMTEQTPKTPQICGVLGVCSVIEAAPTEQTRRGQTKLLKHHTGDPKMKGKGIYGSKKTRAAQAFMLCVRV